MLRMLLSTLLILMPAFLLGQARLSGRFVSNNSMSWKYNEVTQRDDQTVAAKGTLISIIFSDAKITIEAAKGFEQQTYSVLSVKLNDQKMNTAPRVKDFTYNLKDAHGRKVLLLATIKQNGKAFKFDFFKGDSERIRYTNSTDL